MPVVCKYCGYGNFEPDGTKSHESPDGRHHWVKRPMKDYLVVKYWKFF